MEKKRDREHFAEIVLNQWSVIEAAPVSDVTFKKVDTPTKFVTVAELKHKQPVEELINIKGKFRMDHCQITQRTVRGTNKRMLEHALLIDATGHMNVTLREDLADKATEISKTSIPFVTLEDVRLKQFNRDFYPTTTATTVMESTKPFNVDESEKEVELIVAERPKPTVRFTVAHFESVSHFNRYYCYSRRGINLSTVPSSLPKPKSPVPNVAPDSE